MTDGAAGSVGQRYANGDYLEKTGGSWHAEDGEWKAGRLEQCLAHERATLDTLQALGSPVRLVDVGCGSGAALNSMTLHLKKRGLAVSPVGVDPSPDALAVAQRLYPSLATQQGYLIDSPPADLLMLFDVIEHVDDPLALLREAARRARFVALHIPLEENVYARLRGYQRIQNETVGHIHFYHRWSALELLRRAGLVIRRAEYTSDTAERPSQTLKGRIMDHMRLFTLRISETASAHVLGGCSLMVLCQGELRQPPPTRS